MTIASKAKEKSAAVFTLKIEQPLTARIDGDYLIIAVAAKKSDGVINYVFSLFFPYNPVTKTSFFQQSRVPLSKIQRMRRVNRIVN